MRATMGFRQRRRFLRWLAAMTGGIGLHGCGGSGDAPSAGEDLAGPLATPVCTNDDADRSVVRYRLTDLGALPGAFLLRRGGEALDLGTLGGLQSAGYDVNDAGQIAGTSKIGETNAEHAFLYADGRMQDLGTLGGNASGARAINVHGHVVGWADTAAPRTHAFLYSGGLMKDIDVFDGPISEAYGINAADWVVGLAVFPGHTSPHGFVHDGTTLRNLNDLLIDGGRWEITEALDINDAGQIVGSARIRSGAVAHAVLLTPPRAC